MRKRNWKEYNRQLVQRGSLTFLIDPRLFTPKQTKRSKKQGRPQEFSDQLIIMLMIVKIHYRLSYRMLEGFIASLLAFKKRLTIFPSYSLICKRAANLKEALPKLSSRRPSVVILDASGVKVYGEGEWKVKIHGKKNPRKWVKIHIAIDAQSQEIVAVATTNSRVKDGKVTEALLNQVPRSVRKVLADGAYDGQHSREEIRKRGAQALIPPPRNARCWGKDQNRDDAVKVIRALGGDKEAKSLWGKLIGYSRRSLVETTFSRMKRLFGERLFSKIFDKQIIENGLRALLLNRLLRLSV